MVFFSKDKTNCSRFFKLLWRIKVLNTKGAQTVTGLLA